MKVLGEFLARANYAGSHGVKFFAGVEDPGKVILNIDWDSIEAHTNISGAAIYNAMRELNGKYQTAKSCGGHFIMHAVKKG